ncbi:MAG: acetylornithine deacetylase/succinyl-diaminopimelate desuccinylase-like protein [Verrucomicrobiales bacterium]|jgi:acetylornithine deacetylase/succinyl-diaminopimelate desuccinylase-like protein
MSQLNTVLAQLESDQSFALERLFGLLRIESISTDPAYSDACLAAADWLVADLQSIGFEATRRDTPGHPMVVAHSPKKEGPRFLFYGHYDVQPVDPLDLWARPPFDPAIEETPGGKVIRGRGAGDDKGQLMTFIEACRAYKKVTGELPANITIFLEGEEESGSPSLVPFLEANSDELRADIALVCDTGMWDAETPSISTMLRGMVGEEVTITAANKDLHSGLYGGPAINPIRVLTRILSNLHDENGRITLPGFYDGVTEIPDAVKAQWKSLGFDADAFLGAVGLSHPAGEKGYSALEQIWARPTCDVNGINSGYTGPGFKTVLPAQAMAKVSFRLVGEQDPDKIQETFEQYVRDSLPPDCSVEFVSKNNAAATVMPINAPEFVKAQKALTEEWGKEALFAGGGGSIPVVGHFLEILKMDSLLVGFGLDDDAIHSPNEKYNLVSFQKGARSWARILDALTQ